MKNLNEKLQDLKQEFRDRIKAGEFDLVSIEPSSHSGYLGFISITIDGVFFKYSLSDTLRYASEHGEMPLFPGVNHKDDLAELYHQFDLYGSEMKQEKIKRLKQELEKLES